MLEALEQQSPDVLLALIKQYEADERTDKIDLGVGVYRTVDGTTPVFAAVKKAEARLVAEQESKAYIGPEGDMGFVHALMPLVFGPHPARGGRVEGMQTPGGTGAVRLAAALVQRAGGKRVLLGTPSWPNHAQILHDLSLEPIAFDHASRRGSADMDALRAALTDANEGDAILLHGCCHNPTGISYTASQWDEIASLLAARGVLPIIDLAYHGLGEGLEEDAFGVRTVLDHAPRALVAYSCDKNFGLYRDRVGALYMLGQDSAEISRIVSNAHAIARATWSMPPDHGAAVVRMVLRDEGLTELWRAEMSAMRERMGDVRARLAAAKVAGSVDLEPLARQEGMFSVLPLSKEQIAAMREGHGVYMAGSGRINVAGLHDGNIDRFLEALAEVSD